MKKLLTYLSFFLLLLGASTANADLLVNPGFETIESTDDHYPTAFGDWSGDLSEIVITENGITPLEGSQMLHYISAAHSGDTSELRASDVYQLVDLSTFRSDIDAGLLTASASAFFNRIQGDEETDTLFLIELYAFSGTPDNFSNQFDNSQWLSWTDHRFYLLTDNNLNTWEKLTATLPLPPETDYLAINIYPLENVFNDVLDGTVEFDGHYADMVSFSLIIDSDGDGIADPEDECPDSDLSDTVIIDDCDSGVTNAMTNDGCTIADLINQCIEGATNHGDFVSYVSGVTNGLKAAGIISGKEKGKIQKCAAKSDIP